MINLQTSKRVIRTYEQFLPSALTHHNFHSEHSARLPSDKKDEFRDNNFPFGRTISKMIKIEFNEQQSQKQNSDIRIKRKLLTSSQKFQTRKKNNYATSLKQAYCKAAASQKANHSYLTIGSHAIRKMDYSNSIFNKDFRFTEDGGPTKQRFHSGVIKAEAKSVISKKDTKNVLILKKNSNNRLEELLFKNVYQGNSTARMDKTNEKMIITRPNRDGKVYGAEEYIPNRKGSSKKQPFVFGMSEKQLNPEKNRQKLAIYHDFLWKVNYSNALYVRASDQDTTYRAFIGFGNNSNLIRSILKRRYWWTISDKAEGCNFSWTQLKNNNIYRECQSSSSTQLHQIYYKQLQMAGSTKTQAIANLQQGHQRIFNHRDLAHWSKHMKRFRRTQCTVTEKTYKYRGELISLKQIVRIQNSQKLVLHNHLEQNYYIGNKKSLFYHMKKFYQLQQQNIFEALPLTFHIARGIDDPQYKVFLEVFQEYQQRRKKDGEFKNMWIMKPGENSNRGNGINVCFSLDDIRLRIKSKQKNCDGSLRTFILQKYMERPLLYKGRKFDIRHFLLLTSFNGIFKAYWFPQGYIRTSSTAFSLKRNTNLLVHLTNDAVQKNADEYGKYQKGNKVSYQKFQHYLNRTVPKTEINAFVDKILPQMKELTLQAVKATYLSLDPHKREHNFELLGMDFMIDSDLKPWLIEINTNPCLQLSSPLLSRVIPSLIEQTLRLCVDPFFPPPDEWAAGRKMYFGESMLEQNQFELIFDESVHGEEVVQVMGSNTGIDSNMGKIDEDTQTFESEGVEEWEQKSK